MNTAKKLSIRLEAVGGDKVRQEFKNIGSDGQKAFQRITQVITPANDNLKILDNTAKAFNNTLKQAASLAGAYLGLRGLTNTFKSIVETNKEFERLSGSLKTVTGSAKAAKEAFTLIEDFATSTPFQLDEIVDSFIRLKAMGLEPSMEALISYGNTASAFGKNILEFVSAVTSATVGEFERLKTFGIKAKVEGELVKFIFQGITTEVGKNAVEIENYLRSIGTINFGGAMAEQMNTMGGTMSNIEDALAKVARTIGENGLNKAIKEVLDQFNNLISGTDGAAKTIGETLASAVTIAGKAFFTLAKYIEPIITLLTVRLGASLITKGIDLLKASVYALNVALMGTGTAGASATLGLKMMWQVSKVAAVQMYATAVAAKVLAGAVGLLKGIMALLGGPAGLVMLVVYGLYKLIDSHNVAKRAANDHADTLAKLSKIKLISFTNFCPYTVDLEYFKDVRKEFTVQEWLDVILGAIDYNAGGYENEDQKRSMITRLLPFVEKRINLIELAPKGTGKSYLFGGVSRFGYLASGVMSRSKLFFDLSRRTKGLVYNYDYVAFDEIQKLAFVNSDEISSTLKGYMEQGTISFGGHEGSADAGIILLGNIMQENMDEYKNMFVDLPTVFKESALLDRFHGFIRGWDIPRMHDDLKISGWALNSEYFCTMLHLLREDASYRAIVDQILEVPERADTRDTEAIKRIATGYLKLLFPHVRSPKDINSLEFTKYCLRPATKMRQIIKMQLGILDTEYKGKDVPTLTVRSEYGN